MSKILDKLLSGRYFSTLAIVSTYCFTVGACVYFTAKGKLTVEAFLGILTGFSGLATLIVKSYFDRTDREGETK